MIRNNLPSFNSVTKYGIVFALHLIFPIFCIAKDFEVVYEENSGSNHSEVEFWLNNYIEYWEKKDAHAITKCFDENALIIVGAINNVEGIEKPYLYKIQNSKQEYLQRVNKSFTSIHENTKIDQVKIVKHQNIESIFGINIHQQFSRTFKSEKNEIISEVEYSVWTFFIIDTERPKDYQVIYSTVQSDEEYERNGMLTLKDFNIQ